MGFFDLIGPKPYFEKDPVLGKPNLHYLPFTALDLMVEPCVEMDHVQSLDFGQSIKGFSFFLRAGFSLTMCCVVHDSKAYSEHTFGLEI